MQGFAGLFSLLLSLFLILPVSAREGTPEESSYRIRSASGGGYSLGSGTGIGHRVIVTNSHVVGHVAGGLVNYWCSYTKEEGVGFVVSVDRANDLALVVTKEEISCVKIGTLDPSKPATRMSYGGGSPGQLVAITTQYKGGPVNSIKFTLPSIPGDSGGGIHQGGKLVAVLHSTDSVEPGAGSNPRLNTYATDSKMIKPQLEAYDKKTFDDAT